MLLGFVDDDPVLVGEEGDKKVSIRVCNGPRYSRADVPGLAAALLLPAIYPDSQGHLRSLPDRGVPHDANCSLPPAGHIGATATAENSVIQERC